MRCIAALVLALALSGCETTQEESARLRREARHVALASTGLSIARESTQVQVLSAVVVGGPEGAAAAVTVHNRSQRALFAVPIAVTVTAAGGRVLYRNNAPGLEAGLISVPSLAPHQTLTWVDDQLPAGAGYARASARVGEAASSAARAPVAPISAVAPSEGTSSGSGASATLSNRSANTLRDVLVFALARRGGHIVAAGRAVVPEVPAGGSAPAQVYFVGDSRGASLVLQASPPPS